MIECVDTAVFRVFPCLTGCCGIARERRVHPRFIASLKAGFIASLKPRFKFSPHDRLARPWSGRGKRRRIASSAVRTIGEASTARFEVMGGDNAVLGEANASGDVLFQRGMMYSTGSSVPTDFVSAHKWFNLAAVRGNRDAIRLRREIAEQMTESEIAAAQRAARDWLRH